MSPTGFKAFEKSADLLSGVPAIVKAKRLILALFSAAGAVTFRFAAGRVAAADLGRDFTAGGEGGDGSGLESVSTAAGVGCLDSDSAAIFAVSIF